MLTTTIKNNTPREGWQLLFMDVIVEGPKIVVTIDMETSQNLRSSKVVTKGTRGLRGNAQN